MTDQILEKTEKLRLELENNIVKLRKSLRYWQTVEIDYEGLKEEFQILPQDASEDDYLRATHEFGPDIVNEKDVKSLLQEKTSKVRSPKFVVDLLSKRTAYVLQNIESLRRQISDLEKTRNALLLAEDPEYREDAGLPLSEITEELDESGQIISSKVDTPGTDIPKLINTLKDSGLGGFGSSNPTSSSTEDDITLDKPAEEMEDHKVAPNTQTNALNPSPTIVDHKVSNRTINKTGEERGSSQVPQKDAAERIFKQNPDDTEEEAALRQEMNSYGLDEVGAIVAELELEENDSDLSHGDDHLEFDSDFEDVDDSEDDDESEDETGKTTKLHLSNSYRKKMEELQKNLGLKDMKNLGPNPDLPAEVQQHLDKPPAAEAAAKAAIARQTAVAKSSLKDTEDDNVDKPKAKSKSKKKVAFAQSLDIADESDVPKSVLNIEGMLSQNINRPVEDTIIECDPTSKSTNPIPSTPSKPSKFKSTRNSNPQTPMFPPPMDFPDSRNQRSEGPPDKIISDKLVERPEPRKGKIAPPPDVNEIDDELHRREIAMEYFKLRNKRIHQQGGYVGEGENDNYGDDFAPLPVEDENTGQTRKVSRFKAARVKP